MEDSDDPPSFFLCPISEELMRDPVVLHTGHTYDRESIEEWLKTGSTCPNSGQVLEEKHRGLLIPCRTLKEMIHNWEINRISIVEEKDARGGRRERKHLERARPVSCWGTMLRLPVVGYILNVGRKYLDDSASLNRTERMWLNGVLFGLGLSLSFGRIGLFALLAALAGFAIRQYLVDEIRARVRRIGDKIELFLAKMPTSASPGTFFAGGVLIHLLTWRLTSFLMFVIEISILAAAMNISFLKSGGERLTTSEKRTAVILNSVIILAVKLVFLLLTLAWNNLLSPLWNLFVYIFGTCWIYIIFSPIEGSLGFAKWLLATLLATTSCCLLGGALVSCVRRNRAPSI